MAEYRVGEEGATVYAADGRVITWLGPGAVIVPGELPVAGECVPPARVHDGERRAGYDDKLIRPEQGPRS
jgi:hypothetical protein